MERKEFPSRADRRRANREAAEAINAHLKEKGYRNFIAVSMGDKLVIKQQRPAEDEKV